MVQVIACRLLGAKPLSESVLTYCHSGSKAYFNEIIFDIRNFFIHMNANHYSDVIMNTMASQTPASRHYDDVIMSVSNHQPHDWLLNRLFRRRSKKTSKLRVTGLCVGNSPGTGEFAAQMASYAEIFSIWWRHHGLFAQHRFRRRSKDTPKLPSLAFVRGVTGDRWIPLTNGQ